eukprot:6225383-Amphidinium_carterae.1
MDARDNKDDKPVYSTPNEWNLNVTWHAHVLACLKMVHGQCAFGSRRKQVLDGLIVDFIKLTFGQINLPLKTELLPNYPHNKR